MRSFIIAVIATVVASIPCSANAAEMRVLVTTAMKAAIDDLGPAFEKATGHTLNITYGPSGALAKRIAGSEAADLVILAGGIDDLIKQGKIAGDSRRDIARVRIGVAVRKGAPMPDIGTVDSFRNALLKAKSVAYVDPAAGGASGIYLAKMLERLGILAEVNAKARLARGGTEDMVSAIVARGEAEIGLQQISEIMSVAGAALVGPLPDELQTVTVYSAGVPGTAKEAAAAHAFAAFLTTPAAAAVYKTKGLDPG
jgi:molybdate transport system substrate-binding protein